MMGWEEQTFRQGDFVQRPVEVAVKPTAWAGNLRIETPVPKNPLAKSREDSGAGDSQALARWQPMMMRAIAEAINTQVFGGDTQSALRALTYSSDETVGSARRRPPKVGPTDAFLIHWQRLSLWTLPDHSA